MDIFDARRWRGLVWWWFLLERKVHRLFDSRCAAVLFSCSCARSRRGESFLQLVHTDVNRDDDCACHFNTGSGGAGSGELMKGWIVWCQHQTQTQRMGDFRQFLRRSALSLNCFGARDRGLTIDERARKEQRCEEKGFPNNPSWQRNEQSL